ncbi:hypothetical protein QCA50_019467 [Cerrena zonata]|uniref:Uncharacterized protein n=1 Tax=Cerrena zonata TaxID=2478898 RepID=A0AAW0F9D7_9APHY
MVFNRNLLPDGTGDDPSPQYLLASGLLSGGGEISGLTGRLVELNPYIDVLISFGL